MRDACPALGPRCIDFVSNLGPEAAHATSLDLNAADAKLPRALSPKLRPRFRGKLLRPCSPAAVPPGPAL